MKISLLINMKMPTIVGIFIFISRENLMLSGVEHEKSFITLGPGDMLKCCDRMTNSKRAVLSGFSLFAQMCLNI